VFSAEACQLEDTAESGDDADLPPIALVQLERAKGWIANEKKCYNVPRNSACGDFSLIWAAFLILKGDRHPELRDYCCFIWLGRAAMFGSI
jgi:hypothetical protein